MNWLRQRLLAKATSTPPDFVIGPARLLHEQDYLRRWYIIPRNPIFNIYLHRFGRSDDDRALHDHPWLFNASWLLRGTYKEWTFNGIFFRGEGDFVFRWGKSPHRVQLRPAPGLMAGKEQPVWTLFITGPRVREWGFYCPQGWRHWKEFCSNNENSSSVGRGCE